VIQKSLHLAPIDVIMINVIIWLLLSFSYCFCLINVISYGLFFISELGTDKLSRRRKIYYFEAVAQVLCNSQKCDPTLVSGTDERPATEESTERLSDFVCPGIMWGWGLVAGVSLCVF
jgi:hypothetical protein